MKGYIDRHHFAEEILLRERLRSLVAEVYTEKSVKKDSAALNEEKKFRKLLRKLISEAAEEAAPHKNTGINVLSDLLKTVVPQIESEYKLLTTDQEQRESFRAHIINAVQNTLAASRAVDKNADAAGMDMELPMQEQEADVNIDVESDEAPPAEDDEKFIDIDDSPTPDDEEEEDTFGLDGEDQTGRNFAQRAFEKVEKQILEAYALLSNEEDKGLFYDYLITNLKLYFDKFEDELSSSLPEPTTDEYEDESAAAEEDTEEVGDDLDLGGEDEGELEL